MRMRHPKVLRFALVALATVIVVFVAAPSAGAVVQKGIMDLRLEWSPFADRPAYMSQISSQLHAKWVRFNIYWTFAEPARGQYDETYLAGIKENVDLAYARGLKILVTILYTPPWAVDKRFLNSPPNGYKPGAAYKFLAMDRKYLPDFGDLTTKVVRMLGNKVAAYECGNEPNLWVHLYPQQTVNNAKLHTVKDTNFAAHLYIKMLHEFWIHVQAAKKAGQTNALVVAGATAPIGQNNVLSTSPQHFASVHRAGGAANWFDVYSHHPYGTYAAPESPPKSPAHSVTLGNLSVLLKIFPNKPFYLTEYGYTTEHAAQFGGNPVSRATQASYLQRAYSYASKYKQVKVLFWFLVQDVPPAPNEMTNKGVYMGLLTILGVPKLAWFAFAGGNHLTMTTPSTVNLGDTMAISGQLTTSFLPATPSQTLLVECKLPGKKTWSIVKTIHTLTGGAFTTTVVPKASASWRVCWIPIATSSSRTVTVTN